MTESWETGDMSPVPIKDDDDETVDAPPTWEAFAAGFHRHDLPQALRAAFTPQEDNPDGSRADFEHALMLVAAAGLHLTGLGAGEQVKLTVYIYGRTNSPRTSTGVPDFVNVEVSITPDRTEHNDQP